MDAWLNALKALLMLIAGSYLLVCVLLYFGQRKLLYYPQPATPQLSQRLSAVSDVEFFVGDITLRGWLVNPGRRRALLYYGGNAEQIEYNADFFRSQLTDYSVYLIPYRGYGNNGGTPSEKALYQDAEKIFAAIQPQYQSISVMGRSLGSGIATYIAARLPVEKVVLVSPYDSIAKVAQGLYWMIPVKLLLRDKYNSLARAAKISVPTLIVYTDADQVVPARHTLALAEQFNPNLVTVVNIANADHASIGNQLLFESAVTQFFESTP